MKEKTQTAPGATCPAKFVKRLKDRAVREGTMVQLNCQVDGNPEPMVEWLYENQLLKPSQDLRITRKADVAILTILSVQLGDAGLYSCEISNGAGSKMACKSKVTVNEDRTKKFGGKQPTFDNSLKNAQTILGNRAHFDCMIRGSPKPKVRWYHEAEPLFETDNVKFSYDGNRYAMDILKVSEDDTGKYVCRATNSIGERESTAELTTGDGGRQTEKSKPKAPPSFVQVAKDCSVKEGEDASFEFKFTGVPMPTAAWSFNGVPILWSDRFVINSQKPGLCRLAIPKTKKPDAGEYTCSIYNSEGKMQNAAKLVVSSYEGEIPKKKPAMGIDANQTEINGEGKGVKKNPDVGKNSKKMDSKQGTTPCEPPRISKIDSDSRTLSWDASKSKTATNVRYIIEARTKEDKQKDGWKQIASNLTEPKYSIDHLDPGVDYVFRVRTESDSGISEPSEEIDLGRLNKSASRQETISDDEGEEMEDTPPAEDKEYSEPEFLETTEEVYALDGSDTTLTCDFTGYPPPKITWMREDEILQSDDDHFTITTGEGQSTLLVTKVTYDDIGEYECIAVNDKGYSDCRLYLDVAEPPKFVELFQDTEIPFGWSLRLDCRLDGIPEPEVVWSKDDMALKQSGRVKYLFEGEDGASLLLENFSRTDCGEYSIHAFNMAGSITHSVVVTAPGVNIEPVRRFKIKKDVKIGDEYDILEELGRGAYGIVHRAKEKTTGLERAAKFIVIKAGMWEEVRNEIKIMGMLTHRRLIGLYDAYETPREINMAMELVTGGELFERIVSQDTITEGEAVFFLKQVIDGVSHMHERNVVHLDLKPENILLESADSDNIKVIDFGLARVLKPDEEIQVACGTPEFVAPEIIRKQPITPASDVWSIGVIAYILLSGCSPFMGEDDKQTLMNVRDGDWEFEEDIWDNISEEAKDFITRVLVVDVKERYTLKQCLEHPWLRFDELRDRGAAKISTERLKNFNSRRKWRKALNAVKSMMRLRRLSSLIRKEEREEAEKEKEEGEKGTSETDSPMSTSPSASSSGPQTPSTPRLEPLIEEEVEESEENAPPPSVDVNHNELFEMDPSGDGKDRSERTSAPDRDDLEEVRSCGEPNRIHEGDAHLNETSADGMPAFVVPLKDVYLFEEGTLLLNCEFRGRPQPKITWYRGEQVINRRANHIQCWREEGQRACLRVVAISLEEGGEIRCVAENKKGRAETACRINIAEEPDIPSRPKVPLVSSKEAFLTWKIDRQPGKPDVSGYSLMYREYGDEGWTTYEADIRDEFLHITNLKPNTEYRFRAASITQYGKSQLGKPSLLVKTLPDGTPALSSEMITTHKLTHSRSISYNRSLSTDSVVSDIDDDEDEDLIIQDLTMKKDVSPKDFYDFLAEIDRGRYATVKKCRKKINSKEYAAKITRLSDRDKSNCFLEHELLSELKHTNIVQLRDAFQTASHVVLITARYFAGDILKSLTRTDFFTEEVVANVCLQILDALQYLRLNKVLYLDLRHDNVLIESRRRDRIRLVDFGAAMRMDTNKQIIIPREDVIMEFMSPEIVEGSPVGFGTDMWGLGVLLFTWLSGTAAFLAKSEEKTLFNITRPRCNLDQIQDAVTSEARDFLRKIFLRNPSERISVTECFDHPWMHCSPEMIQRRSNARLISRRLRKYRNDYRARVIASQTKHSVFL